MSTGGEGMASAATYGPPNAKGGDRICLRPDGGREDSVSAADSRFESAVGVPSGKAGIARFNWKQASGFMRRREYLSA